MSPCAVAKIRHADVAVAAELDSAGDDSGVDLDAGGALEFKENADTPAISGGACQHPSAAAENGSGERTHQIRRLHGGDGLNLQCPGHECRLRGSTFWSTKLHN